MDDTDKSTTMATVEEEMPADEELSAVLNRRQAINEALEDGKDVRPKWKVFNPYTEFNELSRKEIKEYEKTFKKYDVKKDGFLDLEELKRMMEALGAPQTHLGLKAMIKDVDEDHDGKISFREFLLIYRRARAGELENNSGLQQLAALTEVDVEQVGVGGAKDFFEAKIEKLKITSQYEEEIRREQEEKKQEEMDKKQRKLEFKEKAKLFENGAQAY